VGAGAGSGVTLRVVFAAALVPHPPLLVPALAAGAAPLVASLLAACDAAVLGLLEPGPQLVVCLGAGERSVAHLPSDWGTLAGYGVDVQAPHRHGSGPARLPLSLTIGVWLLERAGWAGQLVMQQVAADASVSQCQVLGARLAAESGPRSAWLVLGDGSAQPGPRASDFDETVTLAFAAADLDALLGLDPALAAELDAAGRPAWQVLAAAASASSAGARAEPGPVAAIEATVHYAAAPFGVRYLVADWRFGS
jgi:hypothetical protein